MHGGACAARDDLQVGLPKTDGADVVRQFVRYNCNIDYALLVAELTVRQLGLHIWDMGLIKAIAICKSISFNFKTTFGVNSESTHCPQNIL